MNLLFLLPKNKRRIQPKQPLRISAVHELSKTARTRLTSRKTHLRQNPKQGSAALEQQPKKSPVTHTNQKPPGALTQIRSPPHIPNSAKPNPWLTTSRHNIPISNKKSRITRLPLRRWGKMDSNHRRQCQQIYSLSPLATREFPLELVIGVEPTTC